MQDGDSLQNSESEYVFTDWRVLENQKTRCWSWKKTYTNTNGWISAFSPVPTCVYSRKDVCSWECLWVGAHCAAWMQPGVVGIRSWVSWKQQSWSQGTSVRLAVGSWTFTHTATDWKDRLCPTEIRDVGYCVFVSASVPERDGLSDRFNHTVRTAIIQVTALLRRSVRLELVVNERTVIVWALVIHTAAVCDVV